MNKHKKFIKDAYEGKYGTICQDWKDTILEHYPEFKEEEFKVGDWVVVLKYGVVRLQMSPLKTWKWTFSDADTNHIDHFNDDFIERKATPKEVEEHLIEEAKKRGFKQGVVVNNKNLESVKWRSTIDSIRSNKSYYKPFEDILWFGERYVYEKGQWAEIIPTMTKEEAEKKLGCKII